MPEFDIKKQQPADKHAQRLLERRNRAFQVLYETMLEVEGAPDADVFAILCRNLCHISKASFAALAIYDAVQNMFVLKSTVQSKNSCSGVVENQLNLEITATDKIVQHFIDEPISENNDPDFCLSQMFPENPIPADELKRNKITCYNLACIYENKLTAVGQIGISDAYELRMKDIVRLYLNLAGMIIQRINTARALSENEEKYRNLVERANDGIVITQDLKIKFANFKFVELTGYNIKKYPDYNIINLFPAEEEPLIRAFFRDHSDETHPANSYETRLIHRNGNEIPVELNAGSILFRGSPAELVFVRDISDRKKSETELAEYHQYLEDQVKIRVADLKKINTQLQQEVEERKLAEQRQAALLKEVEDAYHELQDFAHVISHDLKAPLRGIGSLANWLVTDFGESIGPDGVELLNLLTTRVKRMHRLIDGILKYTKVSRFRETKKVVDLEILFKEVLEMVDVPDNVEIKVLRKLPQIRCVKSRIQQVFFHLLVNAIRFMDKELGEINIDCAEIDDGYWQFSVADNGPGIESKYFLKIFQMFQTLPTKDQVETIGVGLALVKKVVEMHGGQIWVKSKVGEGSCFYFTLPKT